MSDYFSDWLADLESRHFSDLTFPEVSRSLRALSSAYVERRGRLADGAALSGRGKRAAFALFYGPLHFLMVRHIAQSLPLPPEPPKTLVDLGCGTGASGAACAIAWARPPSISGIDRHPWAIAEARETYRAFNLSARVRVDDANGFALPERHMVLAAYTVNELGDAGRAALLSRLLAHRERGGRVLVVEPIARGIAPWWNAWRAAFDGAGGRADEWRVRVPLPSMVDKLDRAAGLNHRELTARSLWL